MYASVKISVWLTLLLAIPASGLIVRIFMFQHDCGHNSFFASARQNRILGRVCSLVTLTPFAYWRRLHARHHGDWNNLDNRGIPADFYSDCLTLAEYEGLSRFKRWLCPGQPSCGPYPSAAAAGDFYAAVSLAIRHAVVLCGRAAQRLCVERRLVAGSRTPNEYRKPEWTPADAALHGASYLKLPWLLRWFSADIGVHHVHHLRPGIPNYRLQDCHEACKPLTAAVTTISIGDALKAPSFMLWDEKRRCMVPFPAP
ncbi:hypothetical protein Dimus_020675 [Dionaea muscipula]